VRPEERRSPKETYIHCQTEAIPLRNQHSSCTDEMFPRIL
jgi:hypothetical protein